MLAIRLKSVVLRSLVFACVVLAFRITIARYCWFKYTAVLGRTLDTEPSIFFICRARTGDDE